MQKWYIVMEKPLSVQIKVVPLHNDERKNQETAHRTGQWDIRERVGAVTFYAGGTGRGEHHIAWASGSGEVDDCTKAEVRVQECEFV